MAAPSDALWRNDTERAAYVRLVKLATAIRALGLKDTHDALDILLRRRKEDGDWDWGVLEDVVNSFDLEFSGQDPAYRNGLRILNGIFRRTFAVKKWKGKLMDLFEISWTREDQVLLDNSLGVITRKAQEAIDRNDVEAAALLSALGHIIRYETKGQFVRRRIHTWAAPAIKDKKVREGLVEDFFTIKVPGSDGRSDATHIRHAFAHAHFEIIANREIYIWDEEDGHTTFTSTLSLGDLLGLSNMFEKKLAIAEVYPSLLAAINDLHSVYKKEWRRFRR